MMGTFIATIVISLVAGVVGNLLFPYPRVSRALSLYVSAGLAVVGVSIFWLVYYLIR